MSKFNRLLADKESRDNQRYKQKQIAAAAGVSPATISRLMSGDVEGMNLATVRKVCEWLDCDIGDLFTLKAEPA